jgi:integrase
MKSGAFRHTYRSWLDQVGTQLAVQQKAMRHTDLRMTLHYGDVIDDRIDQALEKVADLAFQPNSTQTARDSS